MLRRISAGSFGCKVSTRHPSIAASVGQGTYLQRAFGKSGCHIQGPHQRLRYPALSRSRRSCGSKSLECQKDSCCSAETMVCRTTKGVGRHRYWHQSHRRHGDTPAPQGAARHRRTWHGQDRGAHSSCTAGHRRRLQGSHRRPYRLTGVNVPATSRSRGSTHFGDIAFEFQGHS